MKFNPIEILKQVGNVPVNVVKSKFKGRMDNQKRKQAANSIIRNHIIWSMGTGLIPIPVVDFFAVSAVQLDMVRQLSKLYDVDFKETEGKAVITSLTGSGLARIGARAATKLIPGVGTIVGGVTMSVLSGASTYALGEVFKEHFETGGTFLDFDPGRLKKFYQEKFEKGKQVARDIREEEKRKKGEETSTGGFSKTTVQDKKEPSSEDNTTVNEPVENAPKEPKAPQEGATSNDIIIQKVRELAKLKEEGILTDEEFQQMKGRILESYK